MPITSLTPEPVPAFRLTWLLLAGWWLFCGCTFHMEGSRVWIGPDANTDWIDVGSQHRVINGEIREYFNDPSPILTATLLDRGGCSWLLEKAASWWYLKDTNGQPEGYWLHRVISKMELKNLQHDKTTVEFYQP